VRKISSINKAKKKPAPASPWVGQPVVVVLKDGSYYVGRMEQMNDDQLTLAPMQSERRLPASVDSQDKAQISGFLGSLMSFPFGAFSGFMNGNGGGAQAGGESQGNGGSGGGGGGMLGFIGQMLPKIQIGMKLVRTIMPIFGLFK